MGLADEFKTIELGDPRLNRRAVLLAERLGQKPSASIPNACTSWAETAAAYNLKTVPSGKELFNAAFLPAKADRLVK